MDSVTQISDPLTASAGPGSTKVCLVTGELDGPDYNGGIGTANRGLAYALRQAGYSVDILYTRVDEGRPFCFRGTFLEQVEAFRSEGITLRCIRHAGRWNDFCMKSYRAMQHLLLHPYELVFFDDTHGNAYYPLLAKKTGNPGLQSMTMCVVAHSATQWIVDANETAAKSLEDLRLLELERRSIELADVLIAPSRYILSRYKSFGWSLPSRLFVQPNIMPPVVHGMPQRSGKQPVDELVFFGRLESRKGLWLFCRALDSLKYNLVGKKVTFLGKVTYEAGRSTAAKLLRRAAAWPFDVQVLPNFDRDQAISYLKGGNRVAVMPSREDNSPSVILECLQHGIPFIASSGSGGEELLDASSRSENLCLPTTRDLARKVSEVLESGVEPATPAFGFEDNATAYLKLVQDLLRTDEVSTAKRPTAGETLFKLIFLAPERAEPKEIVASVRTAGSLLTGSELFVICKNPELLSRSLGAVARGVQFYAPAEFEDLCKRIAFEADTIVGICHLTRPLPIEWFDRANRAFATDDSLGAVTGLAGSRVEPPSDDSAAYFSETDPQSPSAHELVLGNASALFVFHQDTNSGFALLRSRFLPLLVNHLPVDPYTGHCKQMDHWIHEILMALHSKGVGFELIPDLAVTDRPSEDPSEVYGLGQLMRSLVSTQFGYRAGSNQALLARLAIETLQEESRRRESRRCVEQLARKASLSDRNLRPDASRQEHAAALSALALAAGQTDLATELLSTESVPEEYRRLFSDLTEYVELAASEVSLMDYVIGGNFERLNLNHEWSFRLFEDERALELHVNSSHEGRAAIKIASVSLDNVDTFAASLRLPREANPVRCRLEIAAADRSAQAAHEVNLSADQDVEVEFRLPSHARKLCDVVLSVEMLTHSDPTLAAHVRWRNPRFVRMTKGGD